MPSETICARRNGVDAPAGERDRAARDRIEPGDAVEQRGLAGAVRTDQAADLAGVDLTGHAVERAHAAEAHRHVIDAKQRACPRALVFLPCGVAICARFFVRHCFRASRRAVQRESDCRHCARRTLHFIQVAACGRGARLRGPTRACACGRGRDDAAQPAFGGALVRCRMRRVAFGIAARATRHDRAGRDRLWRACRIRRRKTCRSPSGMIYERMVRERGTGHIWLALANAPKILDADDVACRRAAQRHRVREALPRARRR